MALAGELKVVVRYGSQNAKLTHFVVEGDDTSLLGRDWLQKIKLDWGSICAVMKQTKAQ